MIMGRGLVSILIISSLLAGCASQGDVVEGLTPNKIWYQKQGTQAVDVVYDLEACGDKKINKKTSSNLIIEKERKTVLCMRNKGYTIHTDIKRDKNSRRSALGDRETIENGSEVGDKVADIVMLPPFLLMAILLSPIANMHS